MASCHKEEIPATIIDNNGVVISKPYLWKKSLHLNGSVSNSYVDQAVYYNGKILVPTTNGGTNRRLSLLDPNNGEYLWHWDDRYQPTTENCDIVSYHQYNNLLTYQMGSRSYCINLDNGTTQWKIKRNSSFQVWVSGLDNNYFTFGESESLYPNYQESVAYKGDIETGNISEYIIPDFTLQHIIGNRIGDVTSIEPYSHNGIQYLAIIWQELTDDILWNFQSYLGLYNYNTNQWVYEKKIMNIPNLNGVVLAPPIIYNDKIYANIGHELVCHDLLTGNQIWKKDFTQDFMFSGFIIEDNKLIANNEDTFTYCLNPENGALIWKTQSAGTSGSMSYLNGVVYFPGGSTEKLHAIDINTGKTVWRLDKTYFEGDAFWPQGINVFPAEGNKPAYIIALTSMNAYCFEAYK